MHIEPADKVAKLTVIHEFAKPDSEFLKAVSGGWPTILFGLKTLIEIGESLASSNRY